MKLRPLLKKKYLFIGIAFGLFILSCINLYVNKVAEDYISVVPTKPFYTGILLGAGVKQDGTLSMVLKDRADKAIQLYQLGIIKKILVSGDHGRREYDEVNSIKNYLTTNNIPDTVIFLDHAGFDTYDTMLRAQKIFQVKDAIIISQEFHLQRAVYIARKIGIEAHGIFADNYQLNKWLLLKVKFREVFSKCKAFLDIEILKSSPKFLGAVIPITGSSKSTFDK